jgi:hypothetical protein
LVTQEDVIRSKLSKNAVVYFIFVFIILLCNLTDTLALMAATSFLCGTPFYYLFTIFRLSDLRC